MTAKPVRTQYTALQTLHFFEPYESTPVQLLRASELTFSYQDGKSKIDLEDVGVPCCSGAAVTGVRDGGDCSTAVRIQLVPKAVQKSPAAC